MRSTVAVLDSVEVRAPLARLEQFARHFPSRLRDRHFWFIQFLVMSITALHYGLEATNSEVASIHHIPVIFYLVAVVYGGIHYGPEGGILTALWVVVLTIPSMALLHRGSLMWLGETAQLLVSVGMGAVIAWRVELEARHRRHAEATSRRLALLHDVSAAVTQTLELDKVLGATVAKVAEALESDRAWISVWEGPESEPSLIAEVGEPICSGTPEGGEGLLWKEVSQRLQKLGTPTAVGDTAVAVPLAAEGKLLGALGVACRNGTGYSEDDVEVLASMANQIAQAMDNARLYQDELRMRESLRQYAAQVTRAQEEERKRIARELHDDAVQNLVLLCRQLDALDQPGRRANESEARLAELRVLAESSLQSLRRFSRDLRPSVLDDLGLIPAIDWLASDLSRRTGMAASLEVCGTVRRLSTEGELLLFRIVQEALRNAEKHSGASAVLVTVSFDDDTVTVTVADNGRGFRLGRLRDGSYSGKLGLLGMQERANLLGASIDVQASPGKGTRIEVVAPLASEVPGAPSASHP